MSIHIAALRDIAANGWPVCDEAADEIEELERKLKRICKCEFSSGGVLKKSCEYHNQREVAVERKLREAHREGVKEAAVVAWGYFADLAASRRINPAALDDEFKVCDAIRALMKEGGE
jgi:hypothetical protein